MSQRIPRRTFLEFLGAGTIGFALAPSLLSSCRQAISNDQTVSKIMGINPSSEDRVVLAPGLDYQVLVSWNDPISQQDRFGFNNDYTAFIPDTDNPKSGLLWVNHEYVHPMFVSQYTEGEKSKEQVDEEMYHVGGSIVRIQQGEDGQWVLVEGAPENRRVNGHSMIPFNWPEAIQGSTEAMGTLANCSGGVTPWGTILTCEENYVQFYGERNLETGEWDGSEEKLGWTKFYNNPPEHYGWVVEIDPKTGKGQKHVALGRCSHECATMHQLADGRVVVYTGDDANDECLYKFISSKPGSLSEGTLYVANIEEGRWISLSWEEQAILQDNFQSQTEVLTYLRKAARLVGASQLDRPEDIEIDPITGDVLVALTNNKPKENYFGSILKLAENEGKHDALQFQADTYLAGGSETGFACPDNMAFDPAGNLWFTSDMSGSAMNKGVYAPFKNNGLYVVPRSGEQAGEVIQIASASSDAEFTGPFFVADGNTLFLSVQHPGETSSDLNNLSSNWPLGGTEMPRPSVIAIRGAALETFMG